MTVDLDYLKEIIAVAKESGLSEIEVSEGERTYRCVIQPTEQRQQSQQPIIPIEVVQEEEKLPEPEPKLDLHEVKAPMVGTVYLSPSPGESPFVKEGQKVEAGDVLCLIEAMKMFNKVKADRSGKIKNSLIQDGHSVEFDQTLFELDEA
jgi:acetyl-CoA carboxylase biotin carboxyl carrier protein